jgi:hypothetical protein
MTPNARAGQTATTSARQKRAIMHAMLAMHERNGQVGCLLDIARIADRTVRSATYGVLAAVQLHDADSRTPAEDTGQ